MTSKTLNKPYYEQHKLMEYLNTLHESIVVIVKIEEFQYLKSILTAKQTSELEQKFSKKLLTMMYSLCKFSKIYLLGRGEFAFVNVYSEKNIPLGFYDKIKIFQKNINEEKIKIDSIDYSLSIVLSLAFGKQSLENSLIGLAELEKNKQEFIFANGLLKKEKLFATEKLRTFNMLRTALSDYKIISYFQPIVNNKNRKIEKYESLVRLIDEHKNIISPYVFLETAKEGKYYEIISTRVFKNSFEVLAQHTDIELSINFSAIDIENKRTRKNFLTLLNLYKEHAHRLTIELVEDEKIEDMKSVQDFIKTIKKVGVKIAIDDFGKGYSNFSHLIHYQPDYIKIDGSLIKNIEKSTLSKDLVETIVFFAKKQNIKTIAEFVHNEKIFKILCELGVDYSQGYYFGKPEKLTLLSP